MDDFERGYMTALFEVVMNEHIQVKGGMKVLLIARVFKVMNRINLAVRSRKHGTHSNITNLPESLQDRLVDGNKK